MTNEIFQHVKERRNGRFQKVGIFLGIKSGNKIMVGWSRLNLAEGDIFNKDYGLGLARTRAFEKPEPTPISFSKRILRFQDRCQRYFKDAVLV